MNDERSLSYKDAGVDIAAKSAALSRVKDMLQSTHTRDVLGGIGSFGGLFRAPGAPMKEPILVSSADGVGTKLKVGIRAGRCDTLGIDLVNHCVDDILVQGARPLFFMDYIALGKVREGLVEELVKGLTDACRENETALLGGETAELPGLYQPGEFDLAGFIVGVVDRERLVDGSSIREGDRLLGVPSSGLHTNGYSLAQKILFDNEGFEADTVLDELGRSVGEELLEPHRSYLPVLRTMIDEGRLRGMAHLTGGGFADNIERILPSDVAAVVRYGTWNVLPIFECLRTRGPIALDECLKTFNMGIGMVLVVSPENVGPVQAHVKASGLEAPEIGEIVSGRGEVHIEGLG